MTVPSRRINYDSVNRQVSKIRSLAEDTRDVANQLNNVMTNTSRVWKSDAANVFLGECEIIRQDIRTTASKMDNLASTVSMVAKNIRDEDDARIARYYEELSIKPPKYLSLYPTELPGITRN